ncbi:basic salivary proline-rich protein 1-like [Penaeus vannamei]|uniref:basic salivary proline-rich protein 1-like n=1 Tax=Penaeus vannamei TaxID=6689 RepID=UPI00387F74DE
MVSASKGCLSPPTGPWTPGSPASPGAGTFLSARQQPQPLSPGPLVRPPATSQAPSHKGERRDLGVQGLPFPPHRTLARRDPLSRQPLSAGTFLVRPPAASRPRPREDEIWPLSAGTFLVRPPAASRPRAGEADLGSGPLSPPGPCTPRPSSRQPLAPGPSSSARQQPPGPEPQGGETRSRRPRAAFPPPTGPWTPGPSLPPAPERRDLPRPPASSLRPRATRGREDLGPGRLSPTGPPRDPLSRQPLSAGTFLVRPPAPQAPARGGGLGVQKAPPPPGPLHAGPLSPAPERRDLPVRPRASGPSHRGGSPEPGPSSSARRTSRPQPRGKRDLGVRGSPPGPLRRTPPPRPQRRDPFRPPPSLQAPSPGGEISASKPPGPEPQGEDEISASKLPFPPPDPARTPLRQPLAPGPSSSARQQPPAPAREAVSASRAPFPPPDPCTPGPSLPPAPEPGAFLVRPPAASRPRPKGRARSRRPRGLPPPDPCTPGPSLPPAPERRDLPRPPASSLQAPSHKGERRDLGVQAPFPHRTFPRDPLSRQPLSAGTFLVRPPAASRPRATRGRDEISASKGCLSPPTGPLHAGTLSPASP